MARFVDLEGEELEEDLPPGPPPVDLGLEEEPTYRYTSGYMAEKEDEGYYSDLPVSGEEQEEEPEYGTGFAYDTRTPAEYFSQVRKASAGLPVQKLPKAHANIQMQPMTEEEQAEIGMTGGPKEIKLNEMKADEARELGLKGESPLGKVIDFLGVRDALKRKFEEEESSLKGKDPLTKYARVANRFMKSAENMILLGIPEAVREEVMGPREKEGTAEEIGKGAGSLLGFIVGAPGKITHGVITGLAGKFGIATAEMPFLARAVRQIPMETAGLAVGIGVAKTGEMLAKPTLGEAIDTFYEGVKEGALMGATFGGVKAVMPKNVLRQRIARIAAGTALLDYERGTRPWDDRALAEKIFSYGLDAIFLWQGLGNKGLKKLEGEVEKALKDSTLSKEEIARAQELAEAASRTPETEAGLMEVPESAMPPVRSIDNLAKERKLVIEPLRKAITIYEKALEKARAAGDADPQKTAWEAVRDQLDIRKSKRAKYADAARDYIAREEATRPEETDWAGVGAETRKTEPVPRPYVVDEETPGARTDVYPEPATVAVDEKGRLVPVGQRSGLEVAGRELGESNRSFWGAGHEQDSRMGITDNRPMFEGTGERLGEGTAPTTQRTYGTAGERTGEVPVPDENRYEGRPEEPIQKALEAEGGIIETPTEPVKEVRYGTAGERIETTVGERVVPGAEAPRINQLRYEKISTQSPTVAAESVGDLMVEGDNSWSAREHMNRRLEKLGLNMTDLPDRMQQGLAQILSTVDRLANLIRQEARESRPMSPEVMNAKKRIAQLLNDCDVAVGRWYVTQMSVTKKGVSTKDRLVASLVNDLLVRSGERGSIWGTGEKATGQSTLLMFLMRNKAFKKWFETSVATSPDGTPLPLFRGVLGPGDALKPNDVFGIWFDTRASNAHAMQEMVGNAGAKVISGVIRMNNPKMLTAEEFLTRAPKLTADELKAEVEKWQKQGYDGIYIRGDKRFGTPWESDKFIVFKDQQVKTFDYIDDAGEPIPLVVEITGATGTVRMLFEQPRLRRAMSDPEILPKVEEMGKEPVATPDTLASDDGFVIRRQPDGSYSDGDISYPSYEEAVAGGFRARPDTTEDSVAERRRIEKLPVDKEGQRLRENEELKDLDLLSGDDLLKDLRAKFTPEEVAKLEKLPGIIDLYAGGAGLLLGFRFDDNGNPYFDPELAAIGLAVGMKKFRTIGQKLLGKAGEGKYGVTEPGKEGKFLRGKAEAMDLKSVGKLLDERMIDPSWDGATTMKEAIDKARKLIRLKPRVEDERFALRYKRDDETGAFGNEKMKYPNQAYPEGRNTWEKSGCGRAEFIATNSLPESAQKACYGGSCYAEAGGRHVGRKIAGTPPARVSTKLQDAKGQDVRLGVDTDGSAWLADIRVLDAMEAANPRSLSVYSSCYYDPPPPHPLSSRTIIDVTVSGWHPLVETLGRIEWARQARANGWNVILRYVTADPAMYPKTAPMYNRFFDGLLKTDFFMMEQPLHSKGYQGRTKYGQPLKLPACCQSLVRAHTCSECPVSEGLGKAFTTFWDIGIEKLKGEKGSVPIDQMLLGGAPAVRMFTEAKRLMADYVQKMKEAGRIVDDYVKGSYVPPARAKAILGTDPVPKPSKDIPRWKEALSPAKVFRSVFSLEHNPSYEAFDAEGVYQANTRNARMFFDDVLKSAGIKSAKDDVIKAVQPLFDKNSGLLADFAEIQDRIRLNDSALRKIPNQRSPEAIKLKNENAKLRQEAKALEPAFKQMAEEHSKITEELAKKHADVRVYLQAAGELPTGIKLTVEEAKAAEAIRKWMEGTRDRLKEVGIPVIQDKAYMPHLWRELMQDPDTSRAFMEFKAIPSILKFMSRVPHSKSWIPSASAVMDSYIPTAEFKIAYQPWLNKWNPIIETMRQPNLRKYMTDWRDSNIYSKAAKGWDRVLNGYVAFEYARLIGLSTSVAFKHLLKLPNSWMEHGFLAGSIGTFNSAKVQVESLLDYLGVAHTPSNMKKAYRIYVNQMALVRTMDEIPNQNRIQQTFKAIVGQPVIAVEAFDNGVSVIAGILRGMSKGVPAETIHKRVWETVLDANFRSGWDQPLWQKRTELRALTMFQMTPWKLAEFKVTLIAKALKGESDAFGTPYAAKLVRGIVMVGIAEMIARENNTSILEMFLHIPFVKETFRATPEGYEFHAPWEWKFAVSPTVAAAYRMGNKGPIEGAKEHFKDWGIITKAMKASEGTYSEIYDSPEKYMLGLRRLETEEMEKQRIARARKKHAQEKKTLRNTTQSAKSYGI